jgi:hypothetical protein
MCLHSRESALGHIAAVQEPLRPDHVLHNVLTPASKSRAEQSKAGNEKRAEEVPANRNGHGMGLSASIKTGFLQSLNNSNTCIVPVVQ